MKRGPNQLVFSDFVCDVVIFWLYLAPSTFTTTDNHPQNTCNRFMISEDCVLYFVYTFGIY